VPTVNEDHRVLLLSLALHPLFGVGMSECRRE